MIDISIPLNFYGPQVNAFGVDAAVSRPVEVGEMIGDTRRGGSCNFEQITLIPHCSATHTECVGHITHERIFVTDCLKEILMQVAVVSVEPVAAIDSTEAYPTPASPSDRVITAGVLKASINRLQTRKDFDGQILKALAVRTLPNGKEKLTKKYDGTDMPPYFTNDAMSLIVELGIEHVLVDLPSIDRMDDGGRLSNHRIFWNVPPGSFEAGSETRINSTITELIYVPDEAEDGVYRLNLQIAPFRADAVPSRPLLLRN